MANIDYTFASQAKGLWALYAEVAEEHDKRVVARWREEMDGTLIFAGLFSATVTSYMINGYTNLQPNYAAIGVLLLKEIIQLLESGGAANGTSFRDLNNFRAPQSAVNSNIFFFFSLACSLAGALAAILVKQWTHNYLDQTLHRPSPIYRARVRTYLHNGIQRFGLPYFVHAIPTLLHLSLLLFFAGLVKFYDTVDPIIKHLAATALVICTSIYFILAVVASICRCCPYQTTLSSILWYCLHSDRLLYQLLYRPIGGANPRNATNPREEMMRIAMTGIETGQDEEAGASKLFADDDTGVAWADLPEERKLDLDALHWLTEMLIDNDRFEAFVHGIPPFLNSSSDHIPYPEPLDLLQQLIEHKTPTLGRRIHALLESSRSLGSQREIDRAMASITAIWYLTCAGFERSQRKVVTAQNENYLFLLHDFVGTACVQVANRAKLTILLLISKLLRDADLDAQDRKSSREDRKQGLVKLFVVLDHLVQHIQPPSSTEGLPQSQPYMDRMNATDESLDSIMQHARFTCWAMLLDALFISPPFPDCIFSCAHSNSRKGTIASRIASGLSAALVIRNLQQSFVEHIAVMVKQVALQRHDGNFSWEGAKEQLPLLSTLDDSGAKETAQKILESASKCEALWGPAAAKALDFLRVEQPGESPIQELNGKATEKRKTVGA